MGIGKLDEMVQWGRGKGGGKVTDFNFFFTKNGLEYPPPPTTTDVQHTVRIDTCIHGLYCNLRTKRKRKMRFHNLQYRPRDKVNKRFIISQCSNRGEDFNFKQTFEFSRLYSER